MLWGLVMSIAGAGVLAEPLLPGLGCADGMAPLARARALEAWWAVGPPPATTHVAVFPSSFCCTAVHAVAVDADHRPLAVLWLDADCTVTGVKPSDPAARPPDPRWLVPLGEDPGHTSAKTLMIAWNAGRGPLGLDDRLVEGALFAVRTDGGWDVWFTEDRRGVRLTLGVVSVSKDGTPGPVRADEHPWSPPAGVEDARTMASLRSTLPR